jgi:hypothetical protein
MQLIYTNAESTLIKVTLDEGESLGHLVGPATAFVPIDLANADYAAIIEQKLVIEPSEKSDDPSQ